MVPLEAEPLLKAPWASSGGPPAAILTAVGAGSAPPAWCGRLLPPAPQARRGASAGCHCPQGEDLQKLDPEDGSRAGRLGQASLLLSLFCCRSAAQSCLPFWTPWTKAWQASLSITASWSLPKFTSVESVTPSNHLILGRPKSACSPVRGEKDAHPR